MYVGVRKLSRGSREEKDASLSVVLSSSSSSGKKSIEHHIMKRETGGI